MIYPKFLKANDLIGITAPSSGVGYKIDSFDLSLASIKKQGFKVIETPNVRTESFISSSAEERVKQLDSLITDDEVKMVMCATGGDFMIEILPYLNFENIQENPKWIMGYSDSTSLLYLITTKLDIATIYGLNAASYDQKELHESLKNNFEILKGNLIEQKSFDLYEKDRLEDGNGYNLTEKVYWENLNGEFNQKGRIIGGCLDVIRNLIGTKHKFLLSVS